jgi:hypothetical protein
MGKPHIKIERKCPRCKARRHHWYSWERKQCTCAECSHSWSVRLLKNRDLGELS